MCVFNTIRIAQHAKKTYFVKLYLEFPSNRFPNEKAEKKTPQKEEKHIKRDGDEKGHQNREFILNATRINVSIKSRESRKIKKRKE